jgi:hypothetical protein
MRFIRLGDGDGSHLGFSATGKAPSIAPFAFHFDSRISSLAMQHKAFSRLLISSPNWLGSLSIVLILD